MWFVSEKKYKRLLERKDNLLETYNNLKKEKEELQDLYNNLKIDFNSLDEEYCRFRITQEEKKKQIKNDEKKEVKKNVEVLDIFQQLPLAEQEKIEADILKKIGNQEFFLKTKENNPGIFYSMISSKIREVLEKMNYIN